VDINEKYSGVRNFGEQDKFRTATA